MSSPYQSKEDQRRILKLGHMRNIGQPQYLQYQGKDMEGGRLPKKK